MFDELAIEQTLQQLTNPNQCRAILQQINTSCSAKEKQLIAKLLHSELTKSYFDKNHSLLSRKNLNAFNYSLSNKATSILAAIYPCYTFKQVTTPLSLNVHNKTTDSQLKTQGYCVFPEALNNDLVLAITNKLKKIQFLGKKSQKLHYINSLNALNKIKDSTSWAFDQQDVLRIPEVQQLLMDPTLLSIVQDYLQCPPIHVQANAWWSKPSDNTTASMNSDAQLYHQDKEFIKFLKIFIYLNDVDADNGPHRYIAGSHINYEEMVPSGYKMSDRLSDEYLEKKYPDEAFHCHTGKAGTIIFEDTSGFHKGSPLKTGYRLILQLEFSTSLYLNPVTAFTKKGLTQEYLDFLQQHERFALNYQDNLYHRDLSQRKLQRLKKRSKVLLKELIRHN